MMHYFLERQPEDVRRRAADGKLAGPEFVGQGCTYSVGSDSYGYYVAEVVKPGRLVALVPAEARYVTSWEAGDMTSAMPVDKILKSSVARPAGPNPEFDYIMRYGKNWYWCQAANGEIRRLRGNRARLSWNGSFSYRDPSF